MIRRQITVNNFCLDSRFEYFKWWGITSTTKHRGTQKHTYNYWKSDKTYDYAI